MQAKLAKPRDDAQHELGLGITLKARKVEMVAPPVGALFTDASAGPWRRNW
ncbi:hypothetical protein [Mycobacterium sp. 155]|uniref:hypothetical protein n=1 Tax=Mycobacterium sp. 155 TaxID=1157943 RepID=UPI000370EAAE|nr:hypothetical protein [Mycobacterium sp. 155]